MCDIEALGYRGKTLKICKIEECMVEAGEGLTEEHIHRDTKGSGEVCVHLITQDGRMYYPYSQRWRALVRFVYTSLLKT